MNSVNLKKFRKSGAALVVVGIASLWSLNASAGLMSCTGDLTADGTSRVTGTSTTNTAVSQCEYMTPPETNTLANDETVNEMGFFGITSWTSIFSGDDTKQTPENGQSGTWNILGADFNAYDYMITFKDGANTNLISFLFNEKYSNGDWTTPFTNPPFEGLKEGQSKEVSHYNIFRTANIVPGPGPDTPVPEPGTLALLGLGLAGLTLARRKIKVA